MRADGAGSDEKLKTREMLMAHDMFRREFGLMPSLVRGVGPGDTARAAVIAGHIELVDTVLHHHHASEDTEFWPRLLERCRSDAGPLVDTMERQHAAIATANAELGELIRPWQETAGPAGTARLAGVLDHIVALLHEHLALEEERVLPLLEAHITDDEWSGAVRGGAADIPQARLPLMMGLMMYEGDPAVVRRAIANMPAEIQPVIAGIAGRAFATHSVEVHGTPMPPRSSHQPYWAVYKGQ